MAQKLNDAEDEKEVIAYLNAKKFCYYDGTVQLFVNEYLQSIHRLSSYEDFFNFKDNTKNNNGLIEKIRDEIEIKKGFWYNESFLTKQYLVGSSDLNKFLVHIFFFRSKNFFINNFPKLIGLRVESCLDYIRHQILCFKILKSKAILMLLKDEDRYNFFL